MPPKRQRNDQYVGFRAPRELVARAKRAAEADNRSLSNYILQLISQDLASHLPARAAEEPLEYKTPPPPKKQNGGQRSA